ncbi:MAG: DegV family protein [Coriobacteriales bacterium]|nr:DegV family protein [Coriobacteriales bacterium]
MSFAILTDTSCNLPQHLVDEFEIAMLPLHYYIDGIEHASYTDGKQADFAKFYEQMRAGKVVTTSCASQADAEEAATKLAEAGKDVLCISFSSGISATYSACFNAITEVAKRFPERKIYCVDSLAASAGQGLLIAYVAKLRGEGKTIDECRDWVLEHRLNIAHWFTVDDLMFLKRGGRVSAVSAIFGTALRIKPVLHVAPDGTLKVVDKLRGRGKSIEALAAHFGNSLSTMPPQDQMVYISHADCYEEAKTLADMLVQKYGISEPLITYIDPVVGAHAGPGTIALFYYDSIEHR